MTLFLRHPCAGRDPSKCNKQMYKKSFYVYILASQHYGTLYIGITSNLHRRIYEHKSKEIKGFTADYNVTDLVYYEQFEDFEQAVLKEKRMKRWKRDWKIKLINEHNPHWLDLSKSLNAA